METTEVETTDASEVVSTTTMTGNSMIKGNTITETTHMSDTVCILCAMSQDTMNNIVMLQCTNSRSGSTFQTLHPRTNNS